MSLRNPSEFNPFFGIRLRTVLQRCKNVDVRISGESQGVVEAGLLALVGFAPETTPLNSETLEEMQNCAPELRRRLLEPLFRRWWDKVSQLRIFSDGQGKMNESLIQQQPEFGLYLVSQFTLFADTKKGNRPSYTGALAAPIAMQCFEDFVEFVRSQNNTHPVCSGVFGADMEVSFINDGPVTLIFDCSAESGVTSL